MWFKHNLLLFLVCVEFLVHETDVKLFKIVCSRYSTLKRQKNKQIHTNKFAENFLTKRIRNYRAMADD